MYVYVCICKYVRIYVCVCIVYFVVVIMLQRHAHVLCHVGVSCANEIHCVVEHVIRGQLHASGREDVL